MTPEEKTAATLRRLDAGLESLQAVVLLLVQRLLRTDPTWVSNLIEQIEAQVEKLSGSTNEDEAAECSAARVLAKSLRTMQAYRESGLAAHGAITRARRPGGASPRS